MRIWVAVVVALGLVLALLLLLKVFQRRLIYLPIGQVPPVEAVLPGAEEVAFDTEDGLRLAGWFVPPRGADRRTAVLVFNGNAGNRSYRAPLGDALAAHGFAVMLLDYRGYGGNPGQPTEAGLRIDALAALAYLEARMEDAPIVYFGESLGTGVAVELALERPPAALILRSPFTSLTDIGRMHYPFLPVGLLLTDRFPSLDRIGAIECPLLVIAGERDRIVSASFSRRLFDAAPQPKRLLMIPGVGHNDDELLAGDTMIREIVDFLED